MGALEVAPGYPASLEVWSLCLSLNSATATRQASGKGFLEDRLIHLQMFPLGFLRNS